MPWFTPTCDSQMNVMPTVTVQKVLRVRGFGSRLEQRHYATSRKVAGSNPNKIIGFFK